MCSGFYWYIRTLPRALGSCVYISVKPLTAVLQYINVSGTFLHNNTSLDYNQILLNYSHLFFFAPGLWQCQHSRASSQIPQKTAAESASAQNSCRNWGSASINLTHSTRVLWSLSDAPFYSGYFEIISSCLITSVFKKLLNSLDMHSPSLSVLRIFNL